MTSTTYRDPAVNFGSVAYTNVNVHFSLHF